MVGSARPIWLMTSGGVRMAAATKARTIAYLRFSAKPLDETMPTRANSVNTTGSSKHNPKAKISRITSDRY